MNRRGEVAEMLPWIGRFVMMAVAIVAIVILVQTYKNRDLEAPALHRAAYLYRIYYSDIIMYKDTTTGRVYPGIVDLTKFTDATLNETFYEKADTDQDAKISSRLALTPTKSCGFAEKVMYNNKGTYEHYAPFANTLSDKGGATMEIDSYPVTVKSSGQDCAATLEITIVRPNS